jgi:hypothetical protein
MNWEMDQAWRGALADLSINLSAAWFGAAFITPLFSTPLTVFDTILLVVDVVFGILLLRISVTFKRSL